MGALTKNGAYKTNGNRGRKIKLPSSNWEARSRFGEHGRLRLQQCVPQLPLGKPVSVPSARIGLSVFTVLGSGS